MYNTCTFPRELTFTKGPKLATLRLTPTSITAARNSELCLPGWNMQQKPKKIGARSVWQYVKELLDLRSKKAPDGAAHTYNNEVRSSHLEEAGNGYLRAHLYKPDLGYHHRYVVGGDWRQKEIVLSCSCLEKVTIGGILPRIPPGSLQRAVLLDDTVRLEGS